MTPARQSDTLSNVTSTTRGAEKDTVESGGPDATHTVAVHDGREWHELEVQHGRTLRAVLREYDLSPHGWVTEHVNCDGQGHCSACAVEIEEGADDPEHWLDAFLSGRDLGRLSCQIEVTQDMALRV
ncbi:2Fe-2S iron-sulfur cluster-binding protein [Longibacter sp.]|uniref:2Fe-2S iron-sulfur cluster-binding protein n=1 Tax=Longibacter sp. TaxID=2045415 RepID=UPI003EB893A0